jgi:hypothetical protein
VRLDRKVPALQLTLDHANPGEASGGWLVVAAVINDMKSDLSLNEASKAWSLLARAQAVGGEASEELETLFRTLAHFKARGVARSPD